MNRLAIMQPYFFPYIGYYALIKYTDYFVFFDTPQYIRKGWINRNRILDGNQGWTYITIPITKAHRTTPINQIKIDYNQLWKQKILGQLTVYKKKAPFYNDIYNLVVDILSKDHKNIYEVCIESIQATCKYLGLGLNFDIFSEMNLEIEESIKEADDWALYISKKLGYNIYVNLPGGKEFFHKEKYKENNITLEFLKIYLKPYLQYIGHFESGLSIIDVMMFCRPDEILNMLDDFFIER